MFPEGRIFEFMIVAALALIVVGPKDLPVLMRKVGQFVARMRAMAAEFRASFDEIARQSELDELRREVEAMRAGATVSGVVGAAVGPEAKQVFDDIHSGLHDVHTDGRTDIHTDATEAQPDLPFDKPRESEAPPEEPVQPVKAAS